MVAIARMFSGPGSNYQKLEEKLVSAAEDYIKDDEKRIPDPGTSIEISADTLVSEGYLKELTEYIDDTCSGKVTVMNNGGLSLYLPEVTCTEYKSVTLADQIMTDSLRTEEDALAYKGGLYEMNGEYVFRGKDVNNYVSFGGTTWRILKIDQNGNLRLVKNETEKKTTRWDTKFNAETQRSYGINNYVTSDLYETLNNSYSSFKEENKRHLIPHDVCIGKRKETDRNVDLSIDCGENVLSNQYLSTVNLSDFVLASLDENCKSIDSGSCSNFNYWMENIDTVWTTNASADNTYEVYTFGNAMSQIARANGKNSYYWVVYVSGRELYSSGTGTAKDPYVIE